MATQAEHKHIEHTSPWMTVRHLLEMIRFSHTIFALPFALLAAIMAWHLNANASPPIAFRWQDLLGIVLCMVCARTAAMAMNRLADEQIDALNPRTAKRHLPAGVISRGSVILLAIVSCTAFVASTLLFLPNRLPLYLAVSVLIFLLGYSYTKRFTWLAHAWLGAALMLAPICAWIAVRGQVVSADVFDLLPSVVLGVGVLLWVTGFDIIYACQDAEHDQAVGLKSVPSRFGTARALQMSAALHIAMLFALAALPFVYPAFGWLYWCGWAAIAGLLVYEHSMVRADDLSRVNVAFFHVNAVLSVGLLVIGMVDVFFV
ncbi:MAG: putative 4-hydroxybenzoate polyprenyltransferase [Pirellulales bacterium]|nr:putative 4-hydroxybenzoate polyprenyltransferase [Pirellulales bacterium]